MDLWKHYLLDLLTSGRWVIPTIGLLACGGAFLLGRRMLRGNSTPTVNPEDGFASTLLQGVTSDRRAAPRRRGNIIEVQIQTNELDPLLRGYVLNRSIGGIGLLLEQPLAEGTMIKIRPKQKTGLTSWTDATVRACREEGGQYEVGLQFHRLPNWNELLQFG